MGSEVNVAPLGQRLDELLLRYLEEMEELSDRRERLEGLMEQGWFLLSKARYSMGNKRVSSLQYGATMVPQAHVDISQDSNGLCTFSVHREQSDRSRIERSILEREENESTDPEGPATVRHRTRGSKTERRRDKEEVPDTIQEPLRWFGVLVPQCLRVAQHSFTEVMELAAEITTLQCRVLEVKAQYQKLRGQKEGAPGS